MDFQILGPFRVLDDQGDELRLGGPKQRRVLAVLVLEVGHEVSASRLIDAVWGEQAPDGALASLQVYVSTLRRVLRDAAGRPMLVGHGHGYELIADPESIDARRFLRLVAEGRALHNVRRYADASARLMEALREWRGSPFGDLDVDFAEPQIAELQERRLGACEDRIEADLACGLAGELVAELTSLVEAHPLRERIWGQLMLALYRSGRQADALRAYARARATLVNDLGIDPGPALRTLETLVLRQDPSLSGTAQTTPTGLLQPLTELVGRASEVAAVCRLVSDGHRVVTLTGPGGVGKTRLAIAVATAINENGTRAVCFVPLAAIADPELVLPEIGRALGVQETAGESLPEMIAVAVAGRPPTLLVLDNAEQVIGAAADIGRLASAAPALAVLCTSRGPLHAYGEHQYIVSPLPVARPAGDSLGHRSDAVTLFVQRARAVAPDFGPTDDELPIVAQICARLDGLPLAIELAAARMRMLNLSSLLGRLSEPLSILDGGPRNAPARQRTLRATLDWSWDLLSEGERTMLRGLAVFAGGFTVDDVLAQDRGRESSSAVNNLNVLAALVDHGLVRPVGTVGEVQFELLVTVRQYAAERLRDSGQEQQVRSRHADRVLGSAATAAPALMGPDAVRWLAQLTAQLPDIRVALRWAIDHGEVNRAAGVTAALVRVWRGQGLLRECRQWLEAALDEPAVGDGTALDATLVLGSLAYSMDDYDEASDRLSSVVTAAEETGDEPRLAIALAWLATVRLAQNDRDVATATGIRALAVARCTGNDEALHRSLYSASHLAYMHGDPLAATALTEEDLSLSRRRGDLISVVSCLTNLATLAVDEHRPGDAAAAVEEALGIASTLGHAMLERDLLLVRGRVRLAEDDAVGAQDSFAAALRMSRDMGQRYEIIGALRGDGRRCRSGRRPRDVGDAVQRGCRAGQGRRHRRHRARDRYHPAARARARATRPAKVRTGPGSRAVDVSGRRRCPARQPLIRP